MRIGAFLLLCFGGCATTGTHAAQQFTGTPYDVKDEGDRVTGLVCGVAIDYTVDRTGDVTVLGRFGKPARLEVTREAGVLHISGTLGTRVGADEVDLRLTPERLAGRAGLREFKLAAEGDRLHGLMSTLHIVGFQEATVDGRAVLTAMPDAVVAAVLPTLLNCDRGFAGGLIQPPLQVRFGGPPGYETRAANSQR